MVKAFNKPYLKVVNLEQNASVSTTCVIECRCDIDICGCVGDCTIIIDPSK